MIFHWSKFPLARLLLVIENDSTWNTLNIRAIYVAEMEIIIMGFTVVCIHIDSAPGGRREGRMSIAGESILHPCLSIHTFTNTGDKGEMEEKEGGDKLGLDRKE